MVYLASDKADGITGQILSARNNEIYLFNQNRPIRTLHRSDGSDAAKARRPAQERVRSLRSRRSNDRPKSFHGIRCEMTIVYDKLMALDIAPAEQIYDAKDCMLSRSVSGWATTR